MGPNAATKTQENGLYGTARFITGSKAASLAHKFPRPSGTIWHHLVWQFEHVNDKVHYISVTVDNQTFPVDMYLGTESNFVGEGVDVAFQLDGDSQQNPYSVWLDQVTLTEW